MKRTRTTPSQPRGLFDLSVAATLIGLMASTPLAYAQGKDDKSATASASTTTVVGKTGDAKAGDDSSLYSCTKARGRFKVNLKEDTELKDLVTWAYSFTCKNLIYSSDISSRMAKVTIKSPESMTSQQAWRVFLVALRSMKLTVVPKGNILEIVEDAQVKDKPLPIYDKEIPAATDQMIRAILRPENLSVDDFTQVLTELKSANGNVKGVPKAGLVIVTDYGTNVAKMVSIMTSVDQPTAGERLYILHIKHADAGEMVDTLNQVLGAKDAAAAGGVPLPHMPRRAQATKLGKDGSATPTSPDSFSDDSTSDAYVEAAVPSKLLADERTNTIIMLASEPAYLRVKALIGRLDVDLDVEGGGRIHVYFLENADAEQMATTLQAVITGIQQSSSKGGGARAGGAAGGAPEGGSAFEGQVRVTQDVPTNSLVIVSSVKDFLALRDVIRKLDLPRPQVYIEATIAEITIDNSRKLGTSFHLGKEIGTGDLLVGGLQHSQLSSLNVASLASATGLIGGALGHLLPGAEQLLGKSIPSFGILFQALATNSDVNVLSSPHLLTKNNEEAELAVGENIPYLSSVSGGGFGGAGGQSNGFFPTQSIQRQDVQLDLKVKPHISEGETVSLDIELDISDIASQNFQGLGPSWAKRTIKDKVVVEDQQSVVLGGLIADKITTTESKIPLLGDIPVLGYLFKYSEKTKQKRNLLVLLTPYIVKDQMDLERIVERRTREQQEFVRSFTNFDTMSYRPEMDYRRKHGLVDAINHSVKQAEDEAAVLRDLEDRMITLPDGPIEYGKPEHDQATPTPPSEDGDDPSGAGGDPGGTDDGPAPTPKPSGHGTAKGGG